MISFLPSRRSARRKRAVSGTGQGGEHEAFRDSCPMAYFEPCFRGDFRLRIQGRGYDSGQCGSDPGAYEALVGGCAGPALSASARKRFPGSRLCRCRLPRRFRCIIGSGFPIPISRRSRRAGADLVDDRRAAVHHGTGRSFYRPGLNFGTGIGFGSSPWHRGPFGYARQAFYVPEPSIQAIYSRVLVVEALRADALPKATLEALLPAAKPSGIASKPAPAAKPDGDPSKGPYAPPIALEGEALSKPPYAAPLKATGRIPIRSRPTRLRCWPPRRRASRAGPCFGALW